MASIFSEGSDFKEKLLGIHIITFVIFSFAGMFSSILVNESLYLGLICIGIILSGIMVVLTWHSVFRKDSIIRTNLESQGKGVVPTFICLVFVIPVLTVFGAAKGIPAGIHLLSSYEDKKLVIVEHTASDFSNRHCSGGVYLKDYSYFLNDKLCGLKRSGWESLRPGDGLELYGKKSFMGFTFDRYKKVYSVEND